MLLQRHCVGLARMNCARRRPPLGASHSDYCRALTAARALAAILATTTLRAITLLFASFGLQTRAKPRSRAPRCRQSIKHGKHQRTAQLSKLLRELYIEMFWLVRTVQASAQPHPPCADVGGVGSPGADVAG